LGGVRRHLVTAAVSALALAGCGKDSDEQEPVTPSAPGAGQVVTEEEVAPKETAKRKRPRGKRLKLVDSPYGQVVADRRGEAIYLFDKEKRGKAECYGDCAKAWPPLLTKGEPVAGKGIRKRLLGTTRRRDGKLQVTYRDQPLYYYVADEPGRILCHNVPEFGGLWLVVQGNGRAAPA
jgi:predicted lipoprotein with Yx(FWY)xxD motif